MDIAGLKSELEQHLKRHSHPEAPEGFRDRFEQAVEHHQAETDAQDKAELEAVMKRICDEAEAAANAACADGSEPAGDGGSPDREAPEPGRGGRKGRMGIVVAALAAAAAAAFYFYSGSS